MKRHKQIAACASVFEILVDRLAPRRNPPDAMLHASQRSCGRWLGLRRLSRGVTSDDIVRQTGLDPQILFLLEIGLADESLFSTQVRERLCSTFGEVHRDE